MLSKKLKGMAIISLSACMLITSGCSNTTASNNTDAKATTASVMSRVERGLYRTSTNSDTGNSVVLYYKNEDGLVVPIMRKLDSSLSAEDIINLLKSTDENSADMAKLNLYTLIPKDTTVTVTVNDKVANVNFKNLKNKNAKEEASMLEGVVNTLLALPEVDSVRILLNGKAAEQMAYGSNISKHITKADLNVETIARDVDINSANKIKLYFLSEEGYLIVPTTRYINAKVTVENVMKEFLNGPEDDMNLLSAIPSGTKLNSCKTSANGVVTLDFSEEFGDIKEYTELNTTILKAIALTCKQVKGVEGVEITINGEPLDMDTTTFSSTIYENEY